MKITKKELNKIINSIEKQSLYFYDGNQEKILTVTKALAYFLINKNSYTIDLIQTERGERYTITLTDSNNNVFTFTTKESIAEAIVNNYLFYEKE